MHPADMIFFWAKADPERPAIIQPDMIVTYREFAEAIDAVAARIGDLDLDKQEPVAVSIDHPVRQLAVCYALVRSGFRVAMAARGMLAFLRTHGVQNVIFAGEGQVLSGGRSIPFHDSWLRRDNNKALIWDSARPSAARQMPLIFFTSGTTGLPKKIIVPGDALLDWVPVLPVIGNANGERVLVVPNLSSAMGYNHTSLLFYAGKTACFARGSEPQLALINAFAIDEIIASPQQILDLVQAIEKGARCHVDSLKRIRIGGGFTSADLVKRVQASLCRSVITEYGATETGVIAFANFDLIADVPNGVGFVVPGMQIEIVDDNNNPVPCGDNGRVRFRSSYFEKVHAANNVERTADDGETWWYPGDIGRLTGDGVLCIEGRADDVINCGGVKFSGLELDDAVRAYPGIKDAGVCAVRGASGIEEVWVGVVSDGEIDAAGLKQWLEVNQKPVIVGRIFAIKSMPRNALGKLQRHLLKEALLGMNVKVGS
jgi:acyl-coenzyme A synthetase/AMP-(fatty) acid ligase